MKTEHKCQWMVQAKDWKDCGKPAMWRHRATRMIFCEQHSQYHQLGDLERIERTLPAEPTEYEFTACSGVIFLRVPALGHAGVKQGEVHHGISDGTAQRLRRELNALLGAKGL